VGAVTSEPFSAAASLLCREKQGNSAICSIFGSDAVPQATGFAGLFDQIPYALEQGIFQTEQGILSLKQGACW
jgi:hypothetical protein